jgi:glycosyltransferase involved in cell wall biosynthesis
MARGISPKDFFGVVNARRVMHGLAPDVVHCHTAKGGVFGRLAATTLPRKIARHYSPHGGSLHFDEKSLKGRIFFLAERFLERCSDQLVFVCDYERRTYHQKVGKPRCAETIVYNGLQPDEFSPVGEIDKAADFLFIGMMRDLKGPDLFIEALAGLNTSATAVMVGEGPDLPRYKARVAELGLQDRIQFHPSMNAREAFTYARCIVVPSRAESFPYIVLEAIAAHKALIATDVGGISEIQGTGLVKPDNAKALAHAMDAFLTAEPSERELAAASTELQERFSVEKMAQDILEGYRVSLS